MLIFCPECNLQISDQAISCPHCGFPLRKDKISRPRPYKSNKRRRLPNGFGQISEIKNQKLRKPFRVMVTVGKDQFGDPICKLLKPVAYFETYNEAYAALLEYNKNPYDLAQSMTMEELYDAWSKEYFEKVAYSRVKNTRSVWKYCESIYKIPVINIRVRHLRTCIDTAEIERNGKMVTPPDSAKENMKMIFNLMLDYAVFHGIIEKNYARTFSLNLKGTNEVQKPHITFTSSELRILWNNVDTSKYVSWILVQCYSGWRPQEFLNLELTDIDLDNWTMIGGLKTESGKNRVVPIHSKIKPLIKSLYKTALNNGSKYLTGTKGPYSYHEYRRQFKKVLEELNINLEHRTHDCRVTFVTLATKYEVKDVIIKRIVGHQIDDLTERVYTKRSIEEIATEIEKIKE